MHRGSPFIRKYGGWRGTVSEREIVKEAKEAKE